MPHKSDTMSATSPLLCNRTT